jgi:hypothetical protein
MVAPLLLAAIPALMSAASSAMSSGGGEGGGGGGMQMPSYQAPNMLQAASPLQAQNAQIQATKRNQFKNSLNGGGGMQ